jgi:putative membrane protein
MLVLALAVAIFAVQNAEPVPIRFLAWTAPAVSLGVVIVIAALLGALVGAVAAWVGRMRRRGREMGPPAAGLGAGTDLGGK